MEPSIPLCAWRMLLIFVASIVTPLCAAGENSLNVSLGAEYTNGSYGSRTDTSIWYFPLSVSHQRELTTFSITIPYLIVLNRKLSQDKHLRTYL